MGCSLVAERNAIHPAQHPELRRESLNSRYGYLVKHIEGASDEIKYIQETIDMREGESYAHYGCLPGRERDRMRSSERA